MGQQGVKHVTWVALCRTTDGRTASRRALADCLREAGLPADADVTKTALGQPEFSAHPDWHVSLSHTGPWGACALSGHPVGVDVERTRVLSRPVAQRFFTQEEQDWLKDRPQTEFFRLWTRKESFLKALGLGLTQPLNSFSALEDSLTWQGVLWHFWERELAEGWLTVCTREEHVTFLRDD